MFKKASVVLLATNQQAAPIVLGENLHINIPGMFRGTKFHLYILSDDEIKESNWVFWMGSIHQIKTIHKAEGVVDFINPKFSGYLSSCKKIIAATDTLRITNKDEFGGIDNQHLPQPSQSFIEKYITEYNKGNVITDVLVEYEEWLKVSESGFQLKINPKDNTITIKKVKDSWSRDEVRSLCEDSYLRGCDDGSDDPDIWHRDQTFDEWIEQQL